MTCPPDCTEEEASRIPLARRPDDADGKGSLKHPLIDPVAILAGGLAGAAEGLLVGGAENTVANTGANSATNALRLAKSLASEAQMSEGGTVIAGGQSGTVFRNAIRFVQQHGGELADWVKKTSSSFTASDGVSFQTHWVENVVTGFRTAWKTVFK